MLKGFIKKNFENEDLLKELLNPVSDKTKIAFVHNNSDIHLEWQNKKNMNCVEILILI